MMIRQETSTAYQVPRFPPASQQFSCKLAPVYDICEIIGKQHIELLRTRLGEIEEQRSAHPDRQRSLDRRLVVALLVAGDPGVVLPEERVVSVSSWTRSQSKVRYEGLQSDPTNCA